MPDSGSENIEGWGAITGIKTLFGSFDPGRCDMKWAMGVYSRWWSTGAEDIAYYLDDMAIFDEDHGVTIDEVLTWQG